jgi:hypothetical protein
MVGDFEHVDRGAKMRSDTLGQQLWINLLLDIAGEKHAALTEVQLEHDRHVVDRRTTVGRVQWHGSTQRPIDVEFDSVEPQPVASGHDPARPAELSHLAAVRGVARAGPDHSRFDDIADSVTLKQKREPADMVFVRMRQHDEVEPPIPRRHTRVEQGQKAVGIRARVDEDTATVRPLQEDRVALADIQHRDVKPAVGTRHGHDCYEQ